MVAGRGTEGHVVQEGSKVECQRPTASPLASLRIEKAACSRSEDGGRYHHLDGCARMDSGEKTSEASWFA